MRELRCQTKEAFEKKYSPNAIYYESFIKNLRRTKQFGGADLNEWLDHLEKSKIELFQKRREYINKYQQAAGMIAAGGGHTAGLKADGTVAYEKYFNHLF